MIKYKYFSFFGHPLEFLFHYVPVLFENLSDKCCFHTYLKFVKHLISFYYIITFLRCKCGKCDRILLQNAMECRCCLEIDLCVEAINDELVFRELGCVPSCMTQHPGFRPVCLEIWSLRLASTKYKTRKEQRYRHTGSVPEEKFLRSVSYREFTSLVYGTIGKRRVPLPACAYHAIRNKFKENYIFTGYVDDVNE